MTVVEEILDLARWAPSGDNSQPWRFEARGDDHVVVHAFDTRRHCVYDLEGEASQLSVGAMLETMRIAASGHGRTMRAVRRAGSAVELPLIDVRFEAAPGLEVDPLHASVRERSVQRKPLSTRPLSTNEKAELARSVGPAYSVVWFESFRERLRLAWLAVRSAKVRLTIPEAYAVHREIIEWNARFSEDRVPDQALGADSLSLRSMRWVMANWNRVRTMNRWFGGTYAPRLQLDFIPGLCCAAHFAIIARSAPAGVDDQLAAGAAVQRFWLTATRLQLQLQPQYTPLVFAAYSRKGIAFTSVIAARRRADAVAVMLGALLGDHAARSAVFLGRIGSGPAARSRSLRLP
ncbi:MAG: molybdopterin biosynthesis protein MoeY, partial [Pseudomonadota bacterium]|nr:molybdopterin biosynthesis protein MoeY [Pseudomonadota bacterium]